MAAAQAQALQASPRQRELQVMWWPKSLRTVHQE